MTRTQCSAETRRCRHAFWSTLLAASTAIQTGCAASASEAFEEEDTKFVVTAGTAYAIFKFVLVGSGATWSADRIGKALAELINDALYPATAYLTAQEKREVKNAATIMLNAINKDKLSDHNKDIIAMALERAWHEAAQANLRPPEFAGHLLTSIYRAGFPGLFIVVRERLSNDNVALTILRTSQLHNAQQPQPPRPWKSQRITLHQRELVDHGETSPGDDLYDSSCYEAQYHLHAETRVSHPAALVLIGSSKDTLYYPHRRRGTEYALWQRLLAYVRVVSKSFGVASHIAQRECDRAKMLVENPGGQTPDVRNRIATQGIIEFLASAHRTDLESVLSIASVNRQTLELVCVPYPSEIPALYPFHPCPEGIFRTVRGYPDYTPLQEAMEHLAANW